MQTGKLKREKTNKHNISCCNFLKKQIKVELFSTHVLVCTVHKRYNVPLINYYGFLEDNFDNLSVSLRKREYVNGTNKNKAQRK
jgi:hypothetical protein